MKITTSSNINNRVTAPPFARLSFLVHDVSRMRRTLFDQKSKPLGVTRAQWWALANLSRHESGSMTQSDLARLLDVGKVTIGGLLEKLEASGQIERRLHSGDRRIRRIFVTDLGYSTIDAISETGRGVNQEVMQGISIDNIKIAEEVMHQMKENLRIILQRSNAEGFDNEQESGI